jgi:acetyltransferase-like isoleucine patch superfamily enzyme
MIFKNRFKKLTNRLIIKLGVRLQTLNFKISQASLPQFANKPKNLVIELPRRLVNTNRIHIGDDIWIGPDSLIIAITEYPTMPMQDPKNKKINQTFNPIIRIGNRVTATGGLQIAAHREITIEDDVMFASNINMTDGLHGYENANKPYKYQNMFKIAPITIKKGCWIGQNVVILPGVSIGEFAIIGSNSIVTKSIPDKCIAFGSPTKVIKKWDEDNKRWDSVY